MYKTKSSSQQHKYEVLNQHNRHHHNIRLHITRRRLVSTNRCGTIMRPSWEYCGRVACCLAVMVLWTVIDNKNDGFDESVLAPSWCASVVVVSWIVSWDRGERVAGRFAMTVSWTAFENKRQIPRNRRGTLEVWKWFGCIMDGAIGRHAGYPSPEMGPPSFTTKTTTQHLLKSPTMNKENRPQPASHTS